MPIPGLVEHAVGFQTVAEALYLRDRILDRMQLADGTDSARVRDRALAFVFVGAGYSGVEAVGELRDMAVDACAQFANIEPEHLRFVLIEATDQIFELTREQERHLADQGLSQNVIRQMRTINQEQRREVLEERSDVISAPRN